MLDKEIIAAANRFGLGVFRELVAMQLAAGFLENLFISPLSITSSLVMVYNGATGKTRRELAKALELENIPLETINQNYQQIYTHLHALNTQGGKLALANSIWLGNSKTIRRDFTLTLREYYDVEINNLLIGNDLINRWVSSQTGGKMNLLLENPDPLAEIILLNAVYFKGIWAHAFDPGLTRQESFTTPEGFLVPCKTMRYQGPLAYAENQQSQVASLAFADPRLQIFLIQPATGLADLLSQISSSKLLDWTTRLVPAHGQLSLPRFQTMQSLQLKPALSRMGIAATFQGGFDQIMTGTWIDDVIHQAGMELDEQGVPAGGVGLSLHGEPAEDDIKIKFNHPFFYFIRDSLTGIILFMGILTDPEQR